MVEDLVWALGRSRARKRVLNSEQTAGTQPTSRDGRIDQRRSDGRSLLRQV